MTKKTRIKARRALLTLSLVLVMMMVAVGGTIAWLTAETTEVTNTFTASDVGVMLEETTSDYQMVPGSEIAKDPKVTIDSDSEDCYVFVQITKSTDYDTYLAAYEVAQGWNELSGVPGVYYREAEADDSFYVLKAGTAEGTQNGHVKVKDDVTKTVMEKVAKGEATPTLTFKAYVCQKANVADAATAWAYIQNNGVTPTNP